MNRRPRPRPSYSEMWARCRSSGLPGDRLAADGGSRLSASATHGYQQKVSWYLGKGGLESLPELTAFELKRLLAELQGRGLSPSTVHGFFEVMKACADWAIREGYEVDPTLLRVRSPMVPVRE